MSTTNTGRLKDKIYKILRKHKASCSDMFSTPLIEDLYNLLDETIDETISFIDKFYWLSPKTFEEKSLTNYK